MNIGQWILQDENITKDSEFFSDANTLCLVWGKSSRNQLEANYFLTVLTSMFFVFCWCNQQLSIFLKNLALTTWFFCLTSWKLKTISAAKFLISMIIIIIHYKTLFMKLFLCQNIPSSERLFKINLKKLVKMSWFYMGKDKW